jgi:hypothetical protein
MSIDARSPFAVTESPSEAISFLANGLDWQAGDEVVSLGREFPANYYLWKARGEVASDEFVHSAGPTLAFKPDGGRMDGHSFLLGVVLDLRGAQKGGSRRTRDSPAESAKNGRRDFSARFYAHSES